MPLSRYEIRNEYSLADPELYRAADKDDPEALLEGVAMAGLVGVLRQLGDLAEFAAEIFHNLHEEAMVTAARGHSLMIRVQQLETEAPSIERAFLSQTDHSSFFYHAGVDWHPNLRIDQNLVTQGDLPRFIMDSYEECRAPPRLFLLDKFDVAGAGASLKRYTDPSFFKVEISGMTTTDVQREKKILKPKKKGPRWRNGETLEITPSSHTKLHQLLLEERVENGVNNPSRRVKLKRRLNGFPFNSKTGKSYMEKILKSPSPDHKLLDEVNVNPSFPLTLARSDQNESGVEVLEVRPVSPDRDSVERKRSPPSPDREEIVLNPSIYDPAEVPADDGISMPPNSYHSFATDGMSSTLDNVTGEKVIAVDSESNREGRSTGYESDGIASEVETYVDAPLAIDSEMDTEPELRIRNAFSPPNVKSQQLISDAIEEPLHSISSDSHLTGDSMISDEGNNSSRKEISSFSSDSLSTSAENPESEKSAKGPPSADISEIEIGNASSYKKHADEGSFVDHHSQPGVCDDSCPAIDVTSHRGSKFQQPTLSLCSNESIPTFVRSDSGNMTQNMLREPESDKMAFTLDGNEKETNLALDTPCYPSVADFKLQAGDDSVRMSSVEHQVDEQTGESVPSVSTVPDIICHTTDGSATMSLDLLHEDESCREDQNLVVNIASTILSQNTNGAPESMSSENLIPGKLDEFPRLLETLPSDYPDIAHNGDNIEPVVPQGDLVDKFNNEDSNVSVDAPDCVSGIIGASLGNELKANAQYADTEENHSNSSTENQNSSENMILPHLAHSFHCSQAGLDADEEDIIPKQQTTVNEIFACSNASAENRISSENLMFSRLAHTSDCSQAGLGADEEGIIPEQQTTVNENFAPESSKYCEFVELQRAEITNHVIHYDSEAQETSFHTQEKIDLPAGASDPLEMDRITFCTSSTGREVTECSDSADLKSVNEAHVRLDESDADGEKSSTVDIASTVLAVAVSENAVVANVHLNLGFEELGEQHVHCFGGSGLDKLENYKNCITGSHEESGPVDEMSQAKAFTSDFERVSCDSINNNQPKSEISVAIPDSHDFERVSHNSINNNQPKSEISDAIPDSHDFERASHNSINNNQPKSEISDAIPDSHDFERVSCNRINDNQPKSEISDAIPDSHDFERVSCNSINNNQPISEISDAIPDSHLDLEVDKSLEFVNQPLMDQSGIDSEREAFQKSDLGNQVSDAVTSPVDYDTEESKIVEKIGFLPHQLDQELPHSSEISSDVSPLWPVNHQQVLNHDDHHEGDSHSSFTHSLAERPNSPSVSGLPRQNNSENDVSGYPNGSFSFIAPPHNPFSETNQINLTDLPPLPPLPPVQWRMGKLQHASSLSDGEVMKHREISPQPISPLTASTNGVSSSSHDGNSSLLMTPTGNFKPYVEETNETLIHAAPEPASKEEEKVENSCTGLEAKDKHETVDLPPKIESKQLQLVIPTTPESKFMPPAEEDGEENGSRAVKLPRPRNPLVEDVAVLDKSKLRKVPERVRSQVQKVDERDSILEQIRTKSFNLKPAVSSRPSVQGPQTNLKVAAILEKANAIRQALTGSDEDDDGNWSDS